MLSREGVRSVLLLLSFILFTSAVAEVKYNSFEKQEQEGKLGIYLCTKDLGLLESSYIFSEKHADGQNTIMVSDSDDPNHTLLRHCFVLFGEEVELPDESRTAGKLVLQIFDSAGYGTVRSRSNWASVTSEMWLVDTIERNKFTVSCKRIIKKDDGLENDEDRLFKVWDKLIERMTTKAAEDQYRAVSHNCCNVAIDSIREMRDVFDLTGVNIRNYNFSNVGIKFDWGAESLYDLPYGLVRTLSDTSKGAYRVIASRINNDNEDLIDNKKDEL